MTPADYNLLISQFIGAVGAMAFILGCTSVWGNRS